MADENKVVEGTTATTQVVVEKKDNLFKRVGKGVKNLVCLDPVKAARLKELELDPVTQELEQLRKERGKKILIGALGLTGIVFGVNAAYQKFSKTTTGDEPVDVNYSEAPATTESSEQQ